MNTGYQHLEPIQIIYPSQKRTLINKSNLFSKKTQIEWIFNLHNQAITITLIHSHFSGKRTLLINGNHHKSYKKFLDDGSTDIIRFNNIEFEIKILSTWRNFYQFQYKAKAIVN